MIETTCEKHKADRMDHPQLEDVLNVDQWARTIVKEQVNRGTKRMPLPALAA